VGNKPYPARAIWRAVQRPADRERHMSAHEPARVMVVDDEPHVREFLRDFLTSQRYESPRSRRAANCSTPCRPSSRMSS
jgi:hypothetical protein